jgi:hypothetical protein
MYPKALLIGVFTLIGLVFGTQKVTAQDAYAYGTVVGGEEEDQLAQSYLQENEEGYRITLIYSQGGLGTTSRGSSNRQNSVRLMNVPKDTDYLELFVYYANINPRFIRKGKIKIFRVKDAGPIPYMSENIERYWTEYNFKKQYDKGGPFDKVQPGDIIIVQQKGLINRPFFDPISDLRFILTLPSLALSIFTLYNAFK